MSIGPLHTANSAAGVPLAQMRGSSVDRIQAEVVAQRRELYHEVKADAAAGVGEPDGQDHETDERSADGRRPWEETPAAPPNAGKRADRKSKDASQQSGNLLDLTG